MSDSVFCLPPPAGNDGMGKRTNPERATTSCCGATLRGSLPANKEGKRNAGRRGRYHPHAYGVRGAPRKERLAPRLPLSGALACRRSTSALPKGCVVPWCDPGQVSWANRPRGGGHSAGDRPTSSDAPRMPVVMPADMMPGPPGSKADGPHPRAPHSPLPPGITRTASLRAR
jgi:hypothetical protein